MEPCRPCILDDEGKISSRSLSAVGVGGQVFNDPAVDRLHGRRVQFDQINVDGDSGDVLAPLRRRRGMTPVDWSRWGCPGWRRDEGSTHARETNDDGEEKRLQIRGKGQRCRGQLGSKAGEVKCSDEQDVKRKKK